MLIENDQISEKLHEIADALEEQEENPYRIRAYRRAAHVVKSYPKKIHQLVIANETLTIIPHVGAKLEEIIKKIVRGETLLMPHASPAIPFPENLRKKPKKILSYKIYSIYFVIEKILQRLQAIPEVKKVKCTGDYRRKQEVVTDFNIIMTTTNPETVFKLFHQFPAIKYLVEATASYTTVQLKLGLQITLRAVNENEWGANLLYFTGSNAHYDNLMTIARQAHLIPSETCLFPVVFGCSEKEIYQKLKLEYIPPELRENRGEIAAALQNKIPNLVQLKNIKGDLHCHTTETDGYFSLEEMVVAARAQGYQYVAITDHSQSLKITNGMDEKRLLKQLELIDRLNENFVDFKILKSIEVDILEDGSLDISDDVLKELDLTVCSVHSKFRLPAQVQTDRIIRAMDNPYFNILGHATGRLIKHRQPYEVDMNQILYAAKERHCFIEVNAQPARLDINDIYCKRAKEIGVKVSIASDAHTLNGFNFMKFGVNQARRGWLEAKDVINTYSLDDLKAILKK